MLDSYKVLHCTGWLPTRSDGEAEDGLGSVDKLRCYCSSSQTHAGGASWMHGNSISNFKI